MSTEVYVVTADGWQEEYGARIYLIGVFNSLEAAKEHEEKIIKDFGGGPSDVPYMVRITKAVLNNPTDLTKVYGWDEYSNEYYLGGYCE